MKKIVLKLKTDKIPSIMKESNEDRKERLRYAACMRTKVVPNKKVKSRAQRKNEDRKVMRDYD